MILETIQHPFSSISSSFGYEFDSPQKGQNSISGSVAFSVSLIISISQIPLQCLHPYTIYKPLISSSFCRSYFLSQLCQYVFSHTLDELDAPYHKMPAAAHASSLYFAVQFLHYLGDVHLYSS